MIHTQWLYRMTVLPVTVAALAACSANDRTSTPASAPIHDPLVATYDGGLYVLDGKTLELKADIPLDGFLRVNPAGDDGHVLVTTDEGFRVLDAAGGRLTDDTFPAAKAGHVVPHGDRTVLFADGTGEITTFDPDALADGKPATEQFTTPQAHHGVAVILDDGTMLHSIGDPETRSGAVALRGARRSPAARTAQASTARRSPPTRQSCSVARTALWSSRTAPSPRFPVPPRTDGSARPRATMHPRSSLVT